MSRPLIVFDVDDTLYLERDYVRSGFRAVGDHVARVYGIDGFFDRAWRLFLAGVRRATFDEIKREDPRLASVSTTELVTVYREHAPQIQLESDARDFIELARADFDLAVVTDGPARSQWRKVRALGLLARIDEIVVTDEHPGWGKPAPGAFRHLQSRFGASSEHCVYFGDNPRKDFQGPRELGWVTIRVSRPGSLHAKMPSAGGADQDVSGFSDRATQALLGAHLPWRTL